MSPLLPTMRYSATSPPLKLVMNDATRLAVEAQDRGRRFVDLGQRLDAAVDRHRHDFDGLGAEQIARGVDAVDADVVERAAAEGLLRADVTAPHGHRERRVEVLRLADPALPHEVDHPQVDLLEVQAVGDHQLDAVLGAGGDHPLALGGGHRHRLLAQDVDAGARGANRILRVLRVGQRDVDRVDVLEAGLVVVVVVGAGRGGSGGRPPAAWPRRR